MEFWWKVFNCSKMRILALLVITALVSLSPDQCEAVKCYRCTQVVGEKPQGNCDDYSAAPVECDGTFPCKIFNLTQSDGTVVISKGCNKRSENECFQDKLNFGLAEGCKEATGPTVSECGSAFKEVDVLKFCVCSTDKCNGEGSFSGGSSGGGGGDGGGGDSGARSLKWTATGAGLMMTSILIAAGGL